MLSFKGLVCGTDRVLVRRSRNNRTKERQHANQPSEVSNVKPRDNGTCSNTLSPQTKSLVPVVLHLQQYYSVKYHVNQSLSIDPGTDQQRTIMGETLALSYAETLYLTCRFPRDNDC